MKFSVTSLIMVMTVLLCISVGSVLAENTSSTDWFEKGNLSLQNEKWGDAITAFQNAIKDDPKDSVAWFKLGGSYLQNGNASDAYDAYLNATTLNPEYGEAWAMIGFVRLYELVPPDSAGALEALEKALSILKDNAGVQVNYAIANLLEKKFDVAKTTLEELTQKDPKNERAWYWLGVTRSDNGELEPGLEAFTKAVEINPTFKDAWYAKGDVEGLLGKQNESEKSFDTVLSIEGEYAEPFRSSDVNDADVYYRKGVIAYNNENDEEAMKNFDKALELNPKNHNALYYRGIILFAQDDLAGAGKALDEAIALKEDFANAWYWKGRVELKQQMMDQGVQDLQKATEIDANLTDAWYYLGGVLGDSGSYDEAVQAFDKVTELKPEFADAWYFKGLDQYHLEKPTDAVDSLEQSLKLNSSTFTQDLQANAWYIIGLSQTADGLTEESAKSFNESVALNKSDAVAWNAYGIALNDLKNYEEALNAFEESLTLNESSSESWYNKGNVQRNMNKTEDALTSYDKAIAIDPQPRVWNSKGMALMELGRDEDAIKAFESGLELDDNLAVLWYNKAGALTNLGKYSDAMEAVDKALALDSAYEAATQLKEQITAKQGSEPGQTSGKSGSFTPDENLTQNKKVDKTEKSTSSISFNSSSDDNQTGNQN